MATIKRIVTSEVEGRNLSDFYGDNSLAMDTNGVVNYYGTGKMGPLIAPGVVYGSNADSGDGYGYNTLKLIPHAPDGYVNDDRYLIIDPTAPNHIHIRAGGTQDASNAELILGGEKNFVKINDGSRNVTLSSKQQQTVQAVLNVNIESNDYLVFNDIVPIVAYSGWYIEVNGIKYYVNDVTYPTEGQTQVYVPGAPLQSYGVYNMFSPEATNEWQFDSYGNFYGPGESGVIRVTGIENTAGSNSLGITSSGSMTVNAAGGDMNFYMDGGMYIGASDSNNQIIKRSDLNAVDSKTLPAGGTTGQVLTKVDETDYNSTWTNVSDVLATSTRWSPVFQATGLTFTGTNTSYPTYNSYYVKIGKMVTFNIAIDLSTVTNFGTGQFKAELPFLAIPTAANHFSAWAWVDPTQPADELNGHIQMVADHLPNSQVLDLHWLKETTATPKPLIESTLSQGNPITFTTASKIYINGTYICQ